MKKLFTVKFGVDGRDEKVEVGFATREEADDFRSKVERADNIRVKNLKDENAKALLEETNYYLNY